MASTTQPSVDGKMVARKLLIPTNDSAASIEEVKSIAAQWQPQPTDPDTSFTDEMTTRCEYINKSMQSDMLEQLKKALPKTHKQLAGMQVNLPVYRATVRSKARQFISGGEFSLVDENSERIEGDMDAAFQDMLKRGQFWAGFNDADVLTQGLHRSVVELVWDDAKKCVKPCVWPQQLVHVIPDPDEYWSLDSAYAVAFEMPGESGWGSTDRRYKTWVKVDGESAHYVIGKTKRVNEQDEAKRIEDAYSAEFTDGNDDAVIPYTDPDNADAPLYPFVLWADDLLLAIYWLGDEDALTINRGVNLSFTDLYWGQRFHAHPAGYWEKQGDTTDTPPADVTISPGDMIDGGGFKPAYLSPEYTPQPVVDTWNLMLRMEAMLDGNSAVAQITESSAPESGYALTIRNLPLAEHRMRMVEIYRPFVEETLRRAIIVYNTYAKEAGSGLTPIVGKPVWNPGKMEAPKDPEADARLWALKISKNVATAIDWRMAETGEDHDTAKAAVEANAAANKELMQQGIAGEMFGARFGAAAQAEPEQDEDGKPIQPKDDEPEDESKPAPRPVLRAVPEPDDEDESEEAPAEGEKESALSDNANAESIALKRMIDVGAASAIDMRMIILGESEAEARAGVTRSIEFNKTVAPDVGEAKGKEAAAVIDETGEEPEAEPAE